MASSRPSGNHRPSIGEFASLIRKDDAFGPKIMGIVNVTPDSFYANSRSDFDQAVKKSLDMWNLGAEWVDVGGESTRPGSDEVSIDEELSRVIPVIKELKKIRPDGLISIDTKKFEVAKKAIDAGAMMINDVSGLRNDEMFELVLSEKLPVCIMHMQNMPSDMQNKPKYDDCLREVKEILTNKANELINRGFPEELIILDPGIGFGKLKKHNLELLRGNKFLSSGKFSILNGVSRKSIIGELTKNKDANQRLAGTLAASAYGQMNEVDILRVHDVKEHVDLRNVLSALINK
ncbi:MAG: dihydropteroate synthase [Methanobacteriota archaeon]|nr:MAG: dihydropteroate synthase [Euryarchaeota archaeon]